MSVRQGLLVLLAEKDRHGYQLRQEFEQRTGGTWPVNIGQVYTTLNRLQRDGLVVETARQDDGSVIYGLTDQGRAEAVQWWATPVDRATPSRGELAIKLALAVTSSGVDVRAVLQGQRTESLRALQVYTQHKRRLPARPVGSELARLLVLDNLIFAVEAEVRWLDHIEERLIRDAASTNDHPRGGPPSGGGLADPLAGSPTGPNPGTTVGAPSWSPTGSTKEQS
jgi:DNA-binding PadR family transcriptional regulator